MHLANCNEHPNVVDPSLPCWALRHSAGAKVTPDQAMAEINRLRKALRNFAEYVISVRLTNQPEWMEELAEEVNKACEAIDEEDRFAFDGRDHLTPRF